MSLKAWAGLLGEFGRQSEAYATRQQELEDKRMEEERENRKMAALLAKEQALETWRGNRPLSEREQSVFDEDLAGKKSRRAYEEARAQYYSGGGEQVQALAEQIAEEQGISIEEALPLAQARIPAAGRRASSGGGKSGGADGGLELDKAKLFTEEQDGQTGKTVRRYLDKSVVPMKSDEEMRQEANARAEEWAQGVDSGSGLWDGSMTSRPKPEDIKKRAEEEYQQIKTSYDSQHKAAFEASRRQLDEFNVQPGGLIAPRGKAGQPEDTGKQPSLTDRIGKPNENATIDFEALFKARDDIESNGKDFRPDGKPVKSEAGAMYKNQVMPATAADPGLPGVKPAKITKGMTEKEKAAEYNRVGDDYLKALVERYDGNLGVAYAAYNAGFGRIDRWIENGADQADLPKETRDYVANTMAKYESYASKKSNVLDGQEPQGEPENDLAARVKARAEQYKASAQQQEERPEKKGLLAEAQPDQRSLGTKAGEIAKNMTSLEGISDGQRRRAEAIKEKERISDQQWAEMLEKSGKPIADFIRDFIKAYGGATNSQNKTSERLPTAVTGVRG